MKVTVISIVTGALRMVPKGLLKWMKESEIGDHPNYSITKIVQNTKKSSGDLKRLAVTQTPGKDLQITLI